ncbi:hypothetical protein [Halobacillus sp. A5]|uniref:TcaA second domain-containing protein n=1 Tax=Halobacillus sp. A5 TaxID=2880263 RepID=UPI0020A6CE92|nr:hypothetical protein [Halobacillus sp. A5]MCP3028089.1 hypothetical protein [Halobacillus sp. A5]
MKISKKVKQPADFARSNDWLNASQYYEEYQEEQKSYKKRNWKKIFVSFITLLLLISFAATGWVYLTKITSAEHSVQEFEKAIKNNDADRIVQLVSFDHVSDGFTRSQAKHMVEHYNDHPGEFASTIGYLRASADGAEEEDTQRLHVSNSGQRWVWFDQYKLKLNPAHLNVQTSQENVDLYLNGDQVGEMTEGVYELQGVTPGEHVVKGEVEVNGDKYDQVMSVNTYETTDETIILEFEELSPQGMEDTIEESLEEDIKKAVERHVQDYIEVYENQDISSFTVMKNNSYIEDTEANIQDMKDSEKNFYGDLKNVTYDIGSLTFDHNEETEQFTSSIVVSFILDTGYYLNGEEPEEMLSNENTYSWEYEFTYDGEERKWFITSGTPMAMFKTSNLEEIEYD